MNVDTKRFTDKSPAYGKALLITGGVVLAVWAARKIPWKKLVDEDTIDAAKETFAAVTSKLEGMASDYLHGPVAEAAGHAKKAAGRIASTASGIADSSH